MKGTTGEGLARTLGMSLLKALTQGRSGHGSANDRCQAATVAGGQREKGATDEVAPSGECG
jgi:hypothetical protein